MRPGKERIGKVTRREFTQVGLLLASAAAAKDLPQSEAKDAKDSALAAGDWRIVPATLPSLDWHKVVARPRSSPGLTNWCLIEQNPVTKEVVLSFTEITDPTGKMMDDPPRYDFTGLRLIQRFLVSRDRGESWEPLAEHPLIYAPDDWHLNGAWDRLRFRPDGKLLGLKSVHTREARYPMVFYSHSDDMAKSWTAWRPMTEDRGRCMYSADACQVKDDTWIAVYELYHAEGPFFKNRIRRRPPVWMTRPTGMQRFGCAISDDGGISWKDRPDLDRLEIEGDINAGEIFEPAITRLKNGNLMVVVRRHRLSNLGGAGLPWYQWILEPNADGFTVLSKGQCSADVPLGPTGHPELICTDDGIVLGVRSDGLWASLDDGGYWERIDNRYLGYYPQAIALDDSSILVAGHLGGDNYWPPDKDQEVLLTRVRLNRTPLLRNLDRSVSRAYMLGDKVERDVRVQAQVGTDASVGLLARARVSQGKISGYVLFCTANPPTWLLGRLSEGKLQTITSGSLPGMSLTGVRPHMELAAVGDTLRAFVNTFPVASGQDITFKEGRTGLMAEDGRARVQSFKVLDKATLADIGGEQVELVEDLGAMKYTSPADNWSAF